MIRWFVAGILWSAIGCLDERSWECRGPVPGVFCGRNFAEAQRWLRACMEMS